MNTTANVIVLGAGFAGLRAARSLARTGVDVTVLERKATLGEPVRTSGASWVGAMEALGIPEHLFHRVRVAQFYSRHNRARLEYPEPVGCILHVAELVRFLAEEAEEAGALIRPGIQVKDVLLEGERVVGVRSTEGEHASDLVLDASGVSAFLARKFTGAGFTRYGLGCEFMLEAPQWPEDEIAFWVGPLAPSGYGWAFPEGAGRVRLGMGIIRPDDSTSPRRALEELLNSGRPELAALVGAACVEVRTGAIPSQPPPLRLSGPGWMQVGDCAGQASPLLGEGIRFCLEMGQVAGERAAMLLRSPAPNPGETPPAMKEYAAEWERRYGRKFRLEHRLNRRLSRLDSAGWDRAVQLVGALPGRTPLALLKGEYTPALLAGIFFRHPRLAFELAKGLWQRA